MKIYDPEGFPNPARVRIALAKKGATDKVEFVPVNVTGAEHRTEAFKQRNPDATALCLELADGSQFAGLAFAELAKVDIPKSLSNLTAWRANVAARSSIAG